MSIYVQLLINVLEFIASFLVFLKIRQIFPTSLRMLVIVIPFIFISEIIALVWLQFFNAAASGGNIAYYDITTLLVFLFYYYLYYENIRVPSYRNLFAGACIFSFLFYLVNRSYIQTGNSFHTYSFTICSLCLCLGIIFYLKEMIESEKVVVLNKDPLFWISIGLFAFYIINIPFMGLYNYLLANYFDFLSMLLNVSLGLNIFMYCCIIIGLRCIRN